MSKSLSNSFGLVCLFGILLLLFCFHNQDNLILVIAPRPLLTSLTGKDNISNGLTSKDSYNYYNILSGKDRNSNGLTSIDKYKTSLTGKYISIKSQSKTFPPNNVSYREDEKVTNTEVPVSVKINQDWPYDTPVLLGWEPEKSTNISLYLQPGVNTTMITPR